MKNNVYLAAAALVISLTGPAHAANATSGQQQFVTIERLDGTWDARTKMGTLTDVFHPFANGTAILGEELLNGKQITTTVFYVVHGRLMADHYCDFKNQPRYAAEPSSDPSVIDFAFRGATNIDTHPAYFHSTVWHVVDAQHLVQDWYLDGVKRHPIDVHLRFTRRFPRASAPA